MKRDGLKKGIFDVNFYFRESKSVWQVDRKDNIQCE